MFLNLSELLLYQNALTPGEGCLPAVARRIHTVPRNNQTGMDFVLGRVATTLTAEVDSRMRSGDREKHSLQTT